MKKKLLIIITVLLVGCSQQETFKDVGDIPFDKRTDREDFKICNEANIKQYYVRNSSDKPPNYRGEKRALERAIRGNYNVSSSAKSDGYITIRFIVNCKGETGRFRIEEMDFDYDAIEFEKEIKMNLLETVKNLDQWIPRESGNKSYDFYQYLTFKMKDGKIINILP